MRGMFKPLERCPGIGRGPCEALIEAEKKRYRNSCIGLIQGQKYKPSQRCRYRQDRETVPIADPHG